LNATLSTHTTVAAVAMEVESPTRHSDGISSQKAPSATHDCSRGGLDADVFHELSRWVTVAQGDIRVEEGESKPKWRSKADTSAAAPLSSDDMKVLTTWLRDVADGKRRAHSSLKRITDGPGSATSLPVVPPAVQRALQAVLPGYTPPPPCDSSTPTGTAAVASATFATAAQTETALSPAKAAAVETNDTGIPPVTSASESEDVTSPSTASRAEGQAQLKAAAAVAATAPASVPAAVSQHSADASAPSNAAEEMEGDDSCSDSAWRIPPTHPSLPSIAVVPTQTVPHTATTAKTVELPRRKSLLQRLFTCGGR
jgi:hypothetical protein